MRLKKRTIRSVLTSLFSVSFTDVDKLVHFMPTEAISTYPARTAFSGFRTGQGVSCWVPVETRLPPSVWIEVLDVDFGCFSLSWLLGGQESSAPLSLGIGACSLVWVRLSKPLHLLIWAGKRDPVETTGIGSSNAEGFPYVFLRQASSTELSVSSLESASPIIDDLARFGCQVFNIEDAALLNLWLPQKRLLFIELYWQNGIITKRYQWTYSWGKCLEVQIAAWFTLQTNHSIARNFSPKRLKKRAIEPVDIKRTWIVHFVGREVWYWIPAETDSSASVWTCLVLSKESFGGLVVFWMALTRSNENAHCKRLQVGPKNSASSLPILLDMLACNHTSKYVEKNRQWRSGNCW